jgi:hypothetical protein
MDLIINEPERILIRISTRVFSQILLELNLQLAAAVHNNRLRLLDSFREQSFDLKKISSTVSFFPKNRKSNYEA